MRLRNSRLRFLPDFLKLTGLFGIESKLTAKRKIAYSLIYRDAKTICFERPPFTWHAFVDDCVTCDLYTSGCFQTEHIENLTKWLSENCPAWQRGTTIINVGANIGATALPLNRITQRNIIAIEPVPSTFELLQKNINANDLHLSISAEPYAITATPERVSMVLGQDSGQAELKNPSISPHVNSTSFMVEGRTLISIIESNELSAENVSLVWSDTQGCESNVIASGAALWTAGVYLWSEFCPDLLDKQGSYQEYLDLCSEHFETWIDKSDFETRLRSPVIERHITDLKIHGQWLRASGTYHTDILLIPRLRS